MASTPGVEPGPHWWEASALTTAPPLLPLLLLVLSLAPRGFLRVLRFSPPLKNQHFQIPIRSGTHAHVLTFFTVFLNFNFQKSGYYYLS